MTCPHCQRPWHRIPTSRAVMCLSCRVLNGVMLNWKQGGNPKTNAIPMQRHIEAAGETKKHYAKERNNGNGYN